VHTKNKYLKDKINDLETNSKTKNIRDFYRSITEFKKGYHPRTNLVKDENGDLLADSHSILNRWKNHFCQLLNLLVVNNSLRQTEMHTAEPLVPEPGIAVAKLRSIKQILAEMIQAGGNTLCCEIHKLIKSATAVEGIYCYTYL